MSQTRYEHIKLFNRVWKRFRDIAGKVSQLVVLGSAELLVRDQPVLVLVLVGKDLLDQLVLVLHHLASLLTLLPSSVLHCLDLLLQIAADLVPAQSVVRINVDLLENIDRGGPLLGVNQLDLKEESSAARNDIASALVAITESWRNNQLPLLADAHAKHSLLPALDHLTHANLELEGFAAVVARVELGPGFEGAHVVHGEHVPVPCNLVAGVWLGDILNLQSRLSLLHLSRSDSEGENDSSKTFDCHFVTRYLL